MKKYRDIGKRGEQSNCELPGQSVGKWKCHEIYLQDAAGEPDQRCRLQMRQTANGYGGRFSGTCNNHDRERDGSMDEVKMMISCVVVKDQKKIVRVSFLRGSDYADGVLPEGVVEKSGGFTPAEVQKLESYLRANRQDILRQAKEINPFRNWLGEWKG